MAAAKLDMIEREPELSPEYIININYQGESLLDNLENPPG
jgi:hypothetical protein